MVWAFWFALFFNVYVGRSQNAVYDFTKVDQYATSAPATAGKDPKTLAEYLKKGATTEMETARVIYRWITNNIEIDGFSARYQRTNPNQQKPENVLKRRKADPVGYANLFLELANLTGLKAEVVQGYGRRATDKPITKLPKAPGHAWNKVQIDGQWRLLDACWGSGYLTFRFDFVKQFEGAYFTTLPTTFVLNHLPVEPTAQLLETPVSTDDFLQYPVFYPYPFLNLIRPRLGTLKRSENHTFEVEAPFILSARLVLVGKQKKIVPIQKNGDRYKAVFTFDRQTKDVQLVFEISAGAYQTVAEYKLK